MQVTECIASHRFHRVRTPLRRDCVSDRDSGVKYGRGAERVDKTDRESENMVMDSKLNVLE